jgi:NADPH-dependent F420 reductase
MENSDFDVAIVGGTGLLGGAIARRLAKAGKRVIIGSRDAGKAQAAAKKLTEECKCPVAGGTYAAAAEAAPVILVTTPYASQAATLAEIRPFVQGKLVVDTTVPLVPPKVMRVQLPPEGSSAAAAQRILGSEVRVASAFHNVAAHKLATDESIECDVLVFGDDKESRELVVSIVEACGLRGLHGGALVNSVAAEALTSVLIFMNRTYSVDGAGVRITGALIDPKAR